MAYCNIFANLNINLSRFNFNLGGFAMPNFFLNMPFFNLNNFSYTAGIQQYFNVNMPSVFGSSTSFSPPQMNITNSFGGFNTGNNWQNSLAMPNFDLFNSFSSWQMPYQTTGFDTFNFGNYSTNVFGSKNSSKKTHNNFTYNNTEDKYAQNNYSYMKNLTPEMQERTKKLIAYAISSGYDVEIISGYRTQEEQKQLCEKYKNQPGRAAKNSAHTAGKAIDIRVYKNGQKCDAGYNLLGKYAVSELGMRWGGNFKSFVEKWHFDYDWVKA